MRHLFDQYEGTENRLTHALACCLAEDRGLLAEFLRWSIGEATPDATRLQLAEQQLPGDAELSEGESERRGLPDICLHDADSWCLLVENKIASSLTADQLRRHRRTVARRGFTSIHVLALTPQGHPSRAFEGIHQKRWTEVYRWCRARADASEWAARLATYLEVVETQLTEQEKGGPWTLTTFDGIPFGQQPYSYAQARRLLAVGMQALRQREDLRRELGIAVDGGGRGRITGSRGTGVWDILRFRQTPESGSVNRYPHLTLAIDRGFVLALLILPNGLRPEYRHRLCELGVDGFTDLLRSVAHSLEQALSAIAGWVPWLEVVQRHYPTRSAEAVVDARLEYDLRVALAPHHARRVAGVKPQPLWAEAAFEAFARKRGANLQLAVGVKFPYDQCPAIAGPAALDHIAAAWLACGPLLEAVSGGPLGRLSPK